MSEERRPVAEPFPNVDDDAVYLDDSEIAEEIILEGGDPEPRDLDDDDDDDNGGADEDGEVAGEDVMRDVADGDEGTTEFHDDSVQGFFAHTDSVYCVAVAHGAAPEVAASGGGDDLAYIWDIHTGETRHKLEGHSDSLTDIAFSSDNALLATGGLDGLVKVWDVSTGSLLHSLDGPSEVEWVRWHPKGPVVLAGSNDGALWMWNASSGACMQVFSGHGGSVPAGAFTPDGKQIVSAGEDCTLRVWDPKTGVCVNSWSGNVPLLSLDIHAGEDRILVGTEAGRVLMMQLSKLKVLRMLDAHEGSVEAVAFSRAASGLPMAASAGTDGVLCIWDLQSGSLRHKLQHPDAVVRAVWHPSEPLVFSTCTDGLVRLWDSRTGDAVTTWRGHMDAPLCLAVTDDASTMISAGDDKTCLVFVHV